jgi:hypothetical protein
VHAAVTTASTTSHVSATADAAAAAACRARLCTLARQMQHCSTSKRWALRCLNTSSKQHTFDRAVADCSLHTNTASSVSSAILCQLCSLR